MAVSEKILRSCVHCGFCTATCPTYVLEGDELDSPRGRIYLIKEMFEQGRAAPADIVTHVDRCLSCLSCMTTCPSGVHYMHLVDHARAHIEETYQRPWTDRAHAQPARGGPALSAPLRAGAARRGAGCDPSRTSEARHRARRRRRRVWSTGSPPCWPCAGHLPRLPDVRPSSPAQGEKRGRVASAEGLRAAGLDPRINEAAIRLLTRNGIEVVEAPDEGCCGALVHHMGKTPQALDFARANVDAWMKVKAEGGLDAILITASGCGTTMKDYGFMLREDPAYADEGGGGFAAREGHLRICCRSSISAPWRKPQDRPSPITPPARCSMGRRSPISRSAC